MDGSKSAPLFLAIDAHLCVRRAEARCSAARAYWRQQPVITRRHIELLSGLTCTPASEQEIAHRMGLTLGEALPVIDAMMAIGLLEPQDGGFRATPAAIMYCRNFSAELDGTAPA